MSRLRFLITSLDRGGAEKYLAMVARGLAERGWDVGVGCLKGFGPVAQELKRDGIACRTVRNPLSWLRRERPDILYGFLFHATVAARMAGRLAGVPLVVSSEQLMEMERGARMLAYRATREMCDHYVAVAAAVKSFLHHRLGIPERRISVIPSGVDLGPVSERVEPDLVASIGHLRRNDQKGYRVLVEAAAKLPDVRFVVAGEGPLRRELERGRVRFVGAVEDVAGFLAPAALYVQPSRWEGFPNALIEAMACGKAVVASRVAGIPEQVVDGQTGLLVPPGDADALARAIRKLLGGAREAMGRAGRSRVEREFSRERLVTRHVELFERLLGKR